MKRAALLGLMFCLFCISVPLASAQAGSGDVSFGLGTAHVKASGLGLDFNSGTACSPSVDPACSATESDLSGVFMGFHGDYMFNRRFGVGTDVLFQPAKQDYANFNAISPGEKIQSRMTFWDLNGVARPIRNKMAALQLEGGIGVANLRFYDTVSQSGVLGNTSSNQYISSANHFQVHAGVGVPIYIKNGFFVRPQFDIHYVPNLDEQFGGNLVTQGMVWVGYSFGGK
jgi:Outer membrane protein beta-barrel domain